MLLDPFEFAKSEKKEGIIKKIIDRKIVGMNYANESLNGSAVFFNFIERGGKS